MTYVQLEWTDHRQVQVLHDDGLWYGGWLEAYRHVEGVCSGYVRYTTPAAETRLGWFEEPRIRGADNSIVETDAGGSGDTGRS